LTQRIDAHHHLWHYSSDEYGWIDDSMSALRRDFLADDLDRVVREAGIDGTVAVQARQTLEETRWLLSLAAQSDVVRGVVGWAPIASADFGASLEEFAPSPWLRGLRHIVQAEADDEFILREDFNRGIRRMGSTGLVYDILIYERHLPQTIRFVDQHPRQAFVLDHAAKPRIRENFIEPWATLIRELARRPNVACKVSGLVTEADWSNWSLEGLRPYLDVLVESFTPARLMAGSDWPVCLVASGYRQWFQTLEAYFATFSEEEKNRIFGGTATEIYRLG
jgi:L-fuconolactonase